MSVLIYHFPGNSSVSLIAQKADEFLRDERFAGIKFTSNDFFMLQLVKAMHEDATVLNGFDELCLARLSMGSDGGIGSACNFMAEKFLLLCALYKEGKVREAMNTQYEINRSISALTQFGVMPAEKAALELMGIDMGECIKPMPTLCKEDKRSLQRVLAANGCKAD